jgi:hypothetical protein
MLFAYLRSGVGSCATFASFREPNAVCFSLEYLLYRQPNNYLHRWLYLKATFWKNPLKCIKNLTCKIVFMARSSAIAAIPRMRIYSTSQRDPNKAGYIYIVFIDHRSYHLK